MTDPDLRDPDGEVDDTDPPVGMRAVRLGAAAFPGATDEPFLELREAAIAFGRALDAGGPATPDGRSGRIASRGELSLRRP